MHLSEEEAHHALHVARVKVGESVELFNGFGTEARGVVTSTLHRDVVVTVETEWTVPRPATHLTILQAALNREGPTESLIRRGTELGVASFRFFKGAHSERAPRVKEKWKRIAVEACKQSKRAWLPVFGTTSNLGEALEGPFTCKLIATLVEDAQPLKDSLIGERVALIVGPEGDFSKKEVDEAIEGGAKAVSLGDATYRSETAAVVGATLILYERGELGSRP